MRPQEIGGLILAIDLHQLLALVADGPSEGPRSSWGCIAEMLDIGMVAGPFATFENGTKVDRMVGGCRFTGQAVYRGKEIDDTHQGFAPTRFDAGSADNQRHIRAALENSAFRAMRALELSRDLAWRAVIADENHDCIVHGFIGDRGDFIPNPKEGIALDELFSYEIRMENGTNGQDRRPRSLLHVDIIRDNGARWKAPPLDLTESIYAEEDNFLYFKAGAYTQNASLSEQDHDGDQVTFYKLENTHDLYD